MKHRTAGCWSHDERLIWFGASSPSHYNVPVNNLVATNDLLSDRGEAYLRDKLGRGDRMLLDSGIFNLTNDYKRATGCTMDQALALPPTAFDGFEALFDRYVHLAQQWGDQLWGYIELDQGGKENKRLTRARLHDLGLDPIPVYHPLVDGWDYFDELAESFDRICFGNIVQAAPNVRVRLLHTLWERHRAYPDLWVHVLGLSPNDDTIVFPPESADSSSWISGLQFPKVYLGTSMLSLYPISDPAWRYNVEVDNDAPPEDYEHGWRPLGEGANAATGCYSDEVDFTTKIWQRIAADRAVELGEGVYPPYREQEPKLCPMTPN